MDERLKGRVKTIKLLYVNRDIFLHDLRLGNIFIDMTPETQTTKEKIAKFEFIKIKNFCD